MESGQDELPYGLEVTVIKLWSSVQPTPGRLSDHGFQGCPHGQFLSCAGPEALSGSRAGLVSVRTALWWEECMMTLPLSKCYIPVLPTGGCSGIGLSCS